MLLPSSHQSVYSDLLTEAHQFPCPSRLFIVHPTTSPFVGLCFLYIVFSKYWSLASILQWIVVDFRFDCWPCNDSPAHKALVSLGISKPSCFTALFPTFTFKVSNDLSYGQIWEFHWKFQSTSWTWKGPKEIGKRMIFLPCQLFFHLPVHLIRLLLDSTGKIYLLTAWNLTICHSLVKMLEYKMHINFISISVHSA